MMYRYNNHEAMMSLLVFIFFLSTLTSGIARLHQPRSISCSHLVVFGDSLTDDGIEHSTTGAASHGFGRYSNGPVWPEYLRMLLECGKYDNYAYAGSKSNMDNFYFAGWSGVLWQVDAYLAANPIISDDALIIVQLGGNNDFFTGDNKTFDVAENARRALENMARQGARRVVALNLADLSQAPGVRSAEFSDELKMRIAMLVAEANMKLRITMYDRPDGLVRKFPTTEFHLFDLNSAIMEAIVSLNSTDPFTHHRIDTSPRDIYQYAFHDVWHPSTFVHYRVALAIAKYLEDSI